MSQCSKALSIIRPHLLLMLCMFSLSSLQSLHAAIPERLIQNSSVPSLAPIVEKAAPAVVNIATYTIRQRHNPLLQSPFFRHFFRLPEEPELQRRTQSAGSGVIVNAENGYVLTNHHVIAGADEIEVTLQDGRRFEATLLGSDKKVDLAVLQIPSEKLASIQLAEHDDAKVGDFVIAIGSPFGLQQTVTSGIISALGRNGLGIQGYEDFIQTDASINPGNSGGALIDLRGQLIGINSAILAPSGGNVGIGFAIPASISKAVMQQLIRFGEVKRGGIGASFQDLTPELAEAFNLNRYQGAVVTEVKKGGAAEASGLQQGDIITQANGRAINSADDMANRIGLSPLGDALELAILRAGTMRTIKVEIKEIPIPEIQGARINSALKGALLQDLIPPDHEASIGMMLIEVADGSIAAQQGFEVGDVLFGMNQRRVHSIEELRYLIKHEAPQSFHIRRGYQELVLYLR